MTDTRVVALSGGVGGAKLVLGLTRVRPAGEITVVANVGDDFEHLGLHISPDLDTLMYVLAGLDNPHTGWGRRDDTWHFMTALEALGGESWFRLGDRDLAIHVERTRRLRAGEPLSAVTAALCRRLGVAARLVPASDDPVRTLVHTRAGILSFQDYFVRRGCAPEVTGFEYPGAARARPAGAVLEALASPALEAVVLCPSNPFVSLDPILAVAGMREALAGCPAPVVAVSPVARGAAFKGPTAKMMRELGLAVDPASIAARYRGVADVLVADQADREAAPGLLLPVVWAPTRMATVLDRERLARVVLEAAARVPQAHTRAAAAGTRAGGPA